LPVVDWGRDDNPSTNLISATLLAESVSQMLNVERSKAYVMSAIATTLNYIPTVLVGLFQVAVVYASLSPQSP
jgi:ABC-type tungstate transport system substrate-binding protein